MDNKQTDIVTVKEAAQMLKCSTSTINRLLEEGKLNGWRLGKRGWWNVYRSSVKALIHHNVAE
ncbi:MAG: hypothetical protein IEMM0002_1488 [bacterium]|nr:MAG: hypothetical protein IEMM0002_1488 [bacterium]